jgi:hypothetical protein
MGFRTGLLDGQHCRRNTGMRDTRNGGKADVETVLAWRKEKRNVQGTRIK